MDLQAVARSVLGAEAIQCESSEYLGFGLGELFRQFPEEVVSGRVGSRGKRTPGQKITKAYIKFVQAFQELQAAVPDSASTGEGPSGLGPPNSKRRAKTFSLCTDLACLPVAPTAPATVVAVQHREPPQKPGRKPLAFLNSKSTSWVFAHSQGLIRWGLGLGFTMLLPGFTARAAGILIQIVPTLVAAAVQRLLSSAAEESSRLGTQLVKIAEDSLDICLTTDEPTHPTRATAVASQVLSALANGTAAAEIIDVLSAQTHSQPPVPSSWKLPGWVLLAIGFAARTRM